MRTIHRAETTKKRDGRTPHPYNLRAAVEDFECKYIRNILELASWDMQKTAWMLNIRRTTLEAKMEKYQIVRAENIRF